MITIKNFYEKLNEIDENMCNTKIAAESFKFFVNGLNIPFMGATEKIITIFDFIGIDTSEIYQDLFLVKKVSGKNKYNIECGDIILSPKKYELGIFDEKNKKISEIISVYRKNNDPCFFQIKINVDLIEKSKNEYFLLGYRVLQFTNFQNNCSHLKIDPINANEKTIIDLRSNLGGKVYDMLKIYKSLFPMDEISIRKEEDNFDFRINEKSSFKKLYILCNNLTMSSAEIFMNLIRLGHQAMIFGQNSYGKNMLSKSIEIDNIIFHFPCKKYLVFGEDIKEKKVDVKIENIDDLSIAEIIREVGYYNEN